MIRFLLVGGVNTIFGYIVFTVCAYLTKNAFASVVLSNALAILFNFKTYGSLVFKNKDNSRFYRFCIVYLLLMIIQISLIKVLRYFGITDLYLAGAILTLPMAALTFFSLKKFVFIQYDLCTGKETM